MLKAGSTLRKKDPPMRLALVLATILTLAACETTKGVGRDITNVGNKLDQAF